MNDSEAPSNRAKSRSKKSRKASTSESSKNEHHLEDHFNTIRTARPSLVTPYLRNLIIYFAAVLALAALPRQLLSRIFLSREISSFLKSRAEILSSQQSVFHSVYYLLLYEISSVFLGFLDFLVQAICIVTVLSDEEAAKVQEAQTKFQYIASTTKRDELMIPNSLKRKELIDHNLTLNAILGPKNFRVKIMKLEFLKECLTLNFVAIGVLYFVKIVVRVSEFVQEVAALELLLENCLLSFLLYKNLVYLMTRVWPRKELHLRLVVALLFYVPYFVLKAAYLAQTIYYADNFRLSAGAVLLTAMVYFGADKINASSLVNNARTTLFMVFYSKK
jgi:hypothetical protein